MGKQGGGGGRSKSGGSKSRSSGPSRKRSSAPKSHSTVQSKVSHAKAVRIVKSNQRKGAAFERKLTTAIKRTPGIRTKSVKTQVPTKRHDRADIVARTTSGKKVVIEAKNYRGNPVTKKNVKQVAGYARDLKAKPMLVVSRSTTVPYAVKKYANSRKVTILKHC